MESEHEDVSRQHAAFVAELRHWREVSGYSQKALAKVVGFDPSYVSKIERYSIAPSRDFVTSADQHMHAGRALVRAWSTWQDAVRPVPPPRHAPAATGDRDHGTTGALIVEHEHSSLTLSNGVFSTVVRRQLRNVGTEPVTQYLVRIAVDRFPGDPERSNRLYRADPLTWGEVQLSAHCGDEPMTWRVRYDHDAFKEVWLLFENQDGRFPLYPGDCAWMEYTYSVPERKWGPWWQRAVRVPTERISLILDFPADRDPVVWGMETSMTADPAPFRTQLRREEIDGRLVFNWAVSEPPLHTRYRVEWRFRAPRTATEDAGMSAAPSERMAEIGIVPEGASILGEAARPFCLPEEAEDARRVVAQLQSVMERVSQAHTFAKGMGIAAPQVGIGRAAALVKTPEGKTFALLNPRIIDQSSDRDELYEGCLSFFDVRGLVPRPTAIEVEHQDVDGTIRITAYRGGVARLVGHEIDHLNGILYRERMRAGVETIPVSEYAGTGQPWIG